MTVRIVTADTVITLGNTAIRVPAGTLVDVQPGSALETAYGSSLAPPDQDGAGKRPAGQRQMLRKQLTRIRDFTVS
jgi:hypothetical protein